MGQLVAVLEPQLLAPGRKLSCTGMRAADGSGVNRLPVSILPGCRRPQEQGAAEAGEGRRLMVSLFHGFY